jgi:hypothetical protein
MDKTLFQDYPEDERIEMLESNADALEEMDYTEYLSDEELAERKDKLAQRSIEESRILDEKKEAVDGFKLKLKPIVTEKNELLSEIKHRSRSLFGKCYKMVDHKTKEVGYYNPKGQLVFSRPARPDEAQGNLFKIKTGTND